MYAISVLHIHSFYAKFQIEALEVCVSTELSQLDELFSAVSAVSTG
jgi:hypothetical protein